MSRSDDVAALSASLARSFSASSAASTSSSLAEDDFEAELAGELALLDFPLPPNRHSTELPPSPPHTASSASSRQSASRAAYRLSTASVASAASAASSSSDPSSLGASASPRQFHLPRPRSQAESAIEDARPMSFDQATLAAARSGKEGGMVDKRWSEGSPRPVQNTDEDTRSQRLSQLDFGF